MAKTLEQLQETHSEMLATANDVGVEVPEELRETFSDAKAGATICRLLDKLIKEKNVVAASEETVNSEEAAEEAVPTAKETKVKKAKVLKAPRSAVLNPAKKKAASAAKAAKAKGKKSAVVAKKANGNGATKRPGLDPDAKIVWAKDKEIPGREGSARWKRIANVQKYAGKTVGEWQKSSVAKSGTLRWTMANGLVKLT